MAVEVAVFDEQSPPLETKDGLGRLALAVLEDEGVKGDVEMSLRFVDEEVIAELNERYLGHVGPTDVLSFPIDDEPAHENGPPRLLGDVVVCPAVAAANAAAAKRAVDEELRLLVVHGVLHLLGHDHEVEEEAVKMEAREDVLLERFTNGRK